MNKISCGLSSDRELLPREAGANGHGLERSRTPHGSNPPAEPICVSVKVACDMVGIGMTRMYELIGSGEVSTIKIGRRRLVHIQSLRDLVAGVPPKEGLAVPKRPPKQLPLFD
ncbi:MAG TPA: hypothetical protein VF463_20680 [Sphingobium sp.]